MRDTVLEWLGQWAKKGRAPRRMAHALTRLGAAQWRAQDERVWTHDEADHAQIAG